MVGLLEDISFLTWLFERKLRKPIHTVSLKERNKVEFYKDKLMTEKEIEETAKKYKSILLDNLPTPYEGLKDIVVEGYKVRLQTESESIVFDKKRAEEYIKTMIVAKVRYNCELHGISHAGVVHLYHGTILEGIEALNVLHNAIERYCPTGGKPKIPIRFEISTNEERRLYPAIYTSPLK